MERFVGSRVGARLFSGGLTVDLSLQPPDHCSQPDQWSSSKQELKPSGRMSQRHYIRMIVSLVTGRPEHLSDFSNFSFCLLFSAIL